MNENELADIIINCAFEVHRILGPGLLESVYEAALCRELKDKGLAIVAQKPMPVHYKGTVLEQGYVADKIILEIKSVSEFAPVHFKQLLTYLKLSNLKLGFLLNFNTALLKDGIKRVINGQI